MQTVPLGGGGSIPRPLLDASRHGRSLVAVGIATLGLLIAPATAVHADPLTTLRAKIGQASWYGGEFAKRRTANGERFDPSGMTGAHRTLPLGTMVRVTNLRNGRSVLVRITDRGPFRRGREIDLSYGAARALGMAQRGVAQVKIERLDS